MAINFGVKALLCWVNSIKLSDRELTVDDLQDGTILLKVVYKLKKEPNPCFNHSLEYRLKLIAEFVERDCRFSAAKGTSLSWDNIRDGINLTVEIAKVLLLLVYHDMMNDRCTLNTLDCDAEREIAILTGSFVMESDSCVYLADGLEGRLARKNLPVSREIFARSPTTSTSSVPTISSVSDEDSPVFHRSQKITFVDMQTVASSSVSKSPLQDIMNTPKFQMRKMQRQMIKERDYRDALERELMSKTAILAQNESQITQLQYHLNKMKDDQGESEQVNREQIHNLEAKNDTLQTHLSDILKQNKDLKSTSSLMERKMDELAEENGLLSSQMRAVCSQLAVFEAEVGRLTETQTSSQEEWTSKTSHLQTELNQANAQKELLTEQIQILQGKISCLEEEINRATKEEVGENMGPVMERLLETEINSLKNELESTVCSLKNAELDVQAKTHQLAEYQQEIAQQRKLFEQQKSQSEEMIQAKDEMLDKMQKDITEQRAILQQEIQDLKLQLEQVEQQKTEQMIKIQQHVAACEQEIERLKETKKEKEDLLQQTEEKVADLEAKLSAANSLLAGKDQQIKGLQEEASVLINETKKFKNEIQAKEEMLAKLLLEKSNEEEILNSKIQTLTVQVEDLNSSLKQAEQEIQLKQGLLARTQEENVQQKEILQQQVGAHEEEIQKLTTDIMVKNEHLEKLKNEGSQQAELLEQEIRGLKVQVENLNDSLKKTEEEVHTQVIVLNKQEQESAHQKELLEQQLSASEYKVRSMMEEIQAKEAQMNMLKNQSSEQSDLLHQEICDLKRQIEFLSSSLKSAKDNLKSQEDLFAEQQVLQAQLATSEDEVKRLNAEIHAKEEQLVQLKTDASADSELLRQDVESLNKQMQSMSNSLEVSKELLRAKETLISKQEEESSSEIEALKKNSAVLQKELNQLRDEIQTKEDELGTLKIEKHKESEVLQNEIQTLKHQVERLSESLEIATEQVQAKENQLIQKELEISQEKDALRNMMTASEEEIKALMEEIKVKGDEMDTLKTEKHKDSEVLQNEIKTLKHHVEHLNESLKTATEQVQAKQNLLIQKELEISQEKDALRNMMTTSEEEISGLREEVQAREEQLVTLNREGSLHSDKQQQEITCLKKQLDDMGESLTKSEEMVQTQLVVLNKQEQEISQQKEIHRQQLSHSEEQVKSMKEEIQAKEEQLTILRTDSSEQADLLNQQLQSLKEQIETLASSLRKAEEDMQSKDDVLAQHQEEIQKLKDSQSDKEGLLLKAEEKLQIYQIELSALNTLVDNKEQNLNTLKEEVSLVQKAKEEAEANEKILAEMKEESSKQTDVLQLEIQDLKGEVKNISQKLVDKEQKLLKNQQESSEQIYLLQQQLDRVNEELNQHKERHAAELKQRVDVQELQVVTLREKELLVQEKEALVAQIHQVEKDQKSLQKQLEAINFDRERLVQAKQAIERENTASRKLESLLQQEVETLKMEKEKLLKDKEKVEEFEILKRDLQEQLTTRSQAAEHYKLQLDKAVSHYNNKKELLQENQQVVAELKHSLEVKESEVKAITMENKLLQLDLEKAQTNEKKLSDTVASLKAQLATTDYMLREQSKIHSNGGSVTDLRHFDVPNTRSNIQIRVKKTMSSDSLDQSSLEDSLNSTRKLSAPGEASTPLTRSSERLAAKRRALQAESLETLYFTPINSRHNNRTITENQMELDSVQKNSSSSVKRCRTTQVINTTMSKKTPGCNEDNETFYSLVSARSQPNLSNARPISMELSDTPGRTGADQLSGLPGFRRNTIHSQTASTFCVGTENEPEGGPEDWMRIAELQARNKACLPHLKSSYPIEFETGNGGGFNFTDEELRTGDPSDTIRRASMMPEQLLDSVFSHRHSLMMGQSGAAANTRSRMSLMPGQLPSRTASSSQMRSPKGTKRPSSTLSVLQTSPEKKVKASCFPRPLTPKNKNVYSGPSSSQIRPTLTPADRRQSMAFCIENTPKSNNYLKKGLNKLRSSSRKSPGKNLKSPAPTTVRKYQENIPTGKQVSKATKAQKSPQPTSRSAKSPGLTASARKMIRKMKV